ncbi:DUF4870 domain-containing protein [Leucothrix sargassi]|nr:DUF4870 domain-containing protein [Leucothrix sargassi]
MSKSLSKSEEGIWSLGAHVAALAGLIFPPGLVLGPLLVWLFKRHDSKLVDSNGKEALNFQIMILVLSFLLAVLSAGFKIFIILAFIVYFGGLGLAVYGGVMAKKNGHYNYPFSVRLIK